MPVTMGSVQGYDVLREHFQTGELSPLYAVIENPGDNRNEALFLKSLNQLESDLNKIRGVSAVRSFSTPSSGLLELSKEIRAWGQNLSPASLSQMQIFQDTARSVNDIAVQYPGITRSANFQAVVSSLQKINSVAGQSPGGSSANLPTLILLIQPLTGNIADGLDALSAEFSLQTESSFSAWLKGVYFSADGRYARMDVILASDPYSADSITSVGDVRKTIKISMASSNLPNINYYVGGTSAAQADILEINNTDFLHVLILAIIGITLVTAILLRSLIAPLYMIITVLFNFGATLGISTWLFLEVLNQSSLIYMLPIMVFVILVAVGSDYNIFLVSRIREEARKRSTKEAILAAVTNTGGVITSCGIILAGTFATLTTASLQMVFQVGAAIGIGVLIDTFLVQGFDHTLTSRTGWALELVAVHA